MRIITLLDLDKESQRNLKAFVNKHTPRTEQIARTIIERVPAIHPRWENGIELSFEKIKNMVFGHFVLRGEWIDPEEEAKIIPFHLFLKTDY